MVLLPAIVDKLQEADMEHVLIVAGGIIPDEDVKSVCVKNYWALLMHFFNTIAGRDFW